MSSICWEQFILVNLLVFMRDSSLRPKSRDMYAGVY